MCFSHLCGKSVGLLSIQIKLPFNDMLDKSWFQHAYNSEPKTFLISRTNRDWKDLNFLTNKRWAGSYLSSQRVGGTYTGHTAAKKEHNQTCGQFDVCFTANARRVFEFEHQTSVAICRQSGSNRDISGWPRSPCSHAELPRWENWAGTLASSPRTGAWEQRPGGQPA